MTLRMEHDRNTLLSITEDANHGRPLARPDAGLVLNLDLDRPVCRTVGQREGKALGDVFLKASMRPGCWAESWTGCCGRPVRREKPGAAGSLGGSFRERQHRTGLRSPVEGQVVSSGPPSCPGVRLKAGAGFDDLSKFSHLGRGTRRSNSPSGPASLNRCPGPSHPLCRGPPTPFAASVRLIPS